jgi:hypothetical protein
MTRRRKRMFFVLSIIRIYRICLTRPLDSLENCGILLLAEEFKLP